MNYKDPFNLDTGPITVYLAKSNKCNPTDYMLVRKALLEYNVSILEYKGGTYTDAHILVADMLIVLPESSTMPIILGKGLHTQIALFTKTKNDAYIVTDVNSLSCIKIVRKNVFEYNEQDYTKYSKYVDSEPIVKNLRNILPSKHEILLWE